MTELIRILIADDHPIVRQGLTGLLVKRNGMQVIGEAANGREAVRMTDMLKPDVVLMDMVMPQQNGVEATREIIAANPEARIVILTSFSEQDNVMQALQAGAMGYLLKDAPPDDLLHAIRSVHKGQLTLPQNFARKMQQPAKTAASNEVTLTEREAQVLDCVADGLSNQEIGARLDISSNTVRTHIASLLQKLHASNRTQLAIYAMKRARD